LLYAAGAVAVVTRYGHTAWSLTVNGSVDKMTWGYTNAPALLLSVSIFALAKDICNCRFFQKETVVKLLRRLASGSFGINLILVFLMNGMRNLLGVDIYSPLWLLLGPFGIYVLSLICVLMLRKIPGENTCFHDGEK